MRQSTATPKSRQTPLGSSGSGTPLSAPLSSLIETLPNPVLSSSHGDELPTPMLSTSSQQQQQQHTMMSSSVTSSVTWRREDALVIGRYLFVFRPVVDSLINTIFWGEGHKSLAHLLLFTYCTWNGVCGLRFMTLLTAFHVFVTATSHNQCSDDEALAVLQETMMDTATVLKRYKPSSRWIWPALVLLVALEAALEQNYDTTLWFILDETVGLMAILVLLLARPLLGSAAPQRSAAYHTQKVASVVAGGGVKSPLHSAAPLPAGILKKQGMSPPGFTSRAVGSTTPLAFALPASSYTARTPGNSPLTSPRSVTVETPPLTQSTSDDFSGLSRERTGSGSSDGGSAGAGAAVRAIVARSGCALLASDVCPRASFDDATPQPPDVPDHMHKILTMLTQPGWGVWKLTAEGIDVRTLQMPWCATKAGCTTIVIPHPIEDCVRVINDDDGACDIASLSIFRYDKMLKTYRRIGRDDAINTRTVQAIYRQFVIGVAPRESLMNVTSRYLSADEIANYFGSSAPEVGKRVFVMAMTGACGVQPPAGHERVKLYRHGIIFREIDHQNTKLDLCSSMNLGGKLPEWIVDLGRGETIKVVHQMREEVRHYCRKKQQQQPKM